MWDWASCEGDEDPDVVMACAGDVPTLETLAAVSMLRRASRSLRVRVVNVVDLMRLQPAGEHPHGLSDADFDAIFTTDKPVIFAYHGYPWLIHRLTYRRTNHGNFHVRGYKEEGTTTTPFDMVMLNDLDRFHLVMDAIDRVPQLGGHAVVDRQAMVDARAEARRHTRETGADLPRGHRLGVGNGAVSTQDVLSSTSARAASKLRILDGDDTMIAARDLPAGGDATLADAIAGFADTLVRRPSHRARRQPLSAAINVDDDVRFDSASSSALALLHHCRSSPTRYRESAAAARPARRVLRHCVPRNAPRRRVAYAVPAAWRDDLGVRRYGFIGLRTPTPRAVAPPCSTSCRTASS